ncbi:MAG: sel1 repeat family protein [Firmicutes bacterium]|nr:sel1 repeat family protein [Bacillota bacterium]
MSYYNEEQAKQDIADVKKLMDSSLQKMPLIEGQLKILETARNHHAEMGNTQLLIMYSDAISKLSAYKESLSNANKKSTETVVDSSIVPKMDSSADKDLMKAKLRNAQNKFKYKQKKEIFLAVKELADLGYDRAINYIAHAYIRGDGVEQNLDEAARLAGVLERMGDGSQSYLRSCIAQAKGEAFNEEEPDVSEKEIKSLKSVEYQGFDNFELLDKAWELQNSGDISKAIELLEEMVETGRADVNVWNRLADIYEEKRNFEKAFEYRLRAVADSESSAAEVARCYEQGRGTQKDLSKAFYYYKKYIGSNTHCSTGEIFCPIIEKVAFFYENGIGTERDLVKAFDWYEVLAEAGFVPAKHKLSEFYGKGTGVRQDIAKAQKLLKTAKWGFGTDADDYNPEYGYYNLIEVAKVYLDWDINRAYDFFEQAFETMGEYNYQSSDVKYHLGVAYFTGIGRDQDITYGEQLLREAAEGISDEAKDFCDENGIAYQNYGE